MSQPIKMQRHGRRDQLFFDICTINSMYYSGNFSAAASMGFGKIISHKSLQLSLNQKRTLHIDTLQGFSFKQLSVDTLS